MDVSDMFTSISHPCSHLLSLAMELRTQYELCGTRERDRGSNLSL
jgi:hypothetical protein